MALFARVDYRAPAAAPEHVADGSGDAMLPIIPYPPLPYPTLPYPTPIYDISPYCQGKTDGSLDLQRVNILSRRAMQSFTLI